MTHDARPDRLQPATFGARVGALIIDWGLCMVVATAVFGVGVIRGHDWRLWMPLACYFVEKTVLTATLGGSVGQLLTHLGVMRVDGTPIGWARSAARALGTCLIIPAVVSHEGHALHDTLLGTVVVRRR